MHGGLQLWVLKSTVRGPGSPSAAREAKTPRAFHQLCREDQVWEELGKINRVIPPREGIFTKVLVPWAGTEAAAARAAGGAHQGGGEKGSIHQGWEGPLGQTGVARRRPRGRDPREDTEAAAEYWRTLAPQAIPPKGIGTQPPERSEKDHSCLRASASVSKPRGASHLGSRTGAPSSVPCCLHTGHLPTTFPQPAGGATGRQREPVSLFITSRPPRQRWIGGDCRPLYVSSITPACRRLRRRPAGLPPAPTPGPHPSPTPTLAASSWSLRPRGGAGRLAWGVTRLRKVLGTPASPWLPRICPALFHRVI